MDKRAELLRSMKFLFFSISAGLIEIVSFALLNETLGWPYWPCYLIALILSVLSDLHSRQHSSRQLAGRNRWLERISGHRAEYGNEFCSGVSVRSFLCVSGQYRYKRTRQKGTGFPLIVREACSLLCTLRMICKTADYIGHPCFTDNQPAFIRTAAAAPGSVVPSSITRETSLPRSSCR